MIATIILTAVLAGGQDQSAPICRRDGNGLEVIACAHDDLNAEEVRMLTYLVAARERAIDADRESGAYGGRPTQQLAYINASQSAWDAYAEIRCGGVYDQWRHGTNGIVMSLECQIAATRQRTHDIWTDYLTFEDSTPPILPEPVGAPPAELPEPRWP